MTLMIGISPAEMEALERYGFCAVPSHKANGFTGRDEDVGHQTVSLECGNKKVECLLVSTHPSKHDDDLQIEIFKKI